MANLAREEQEGHVVLPSPELIFRALELVSPSEVRVLLLGQDPYIHSGQAMGLAFSVPTGCAHPPSLRNIFTEVEADCGVPRPESGDLTRWAQQGVLLLNAVLTVREGASLSHANWGWEAITSAIVAHLSELKTPVVFMQWGRQAQAKGRVIACGPSNHVIATPHPSPLSARRGFFGAKPFSQANQWLVQQGCEPIQW